MMKGILFAIFIFAAFASEKAIDFEENILELEARIEKLNKEITRADEDYGNFEKERKIQIRKLEDAKDWKNIFKQYGFGQDFINKFEETYEESNTPQTWKYVKNEDLVKMGFNGVKISVLWDRFYDQELKNIHGNVSYFEENNMKLQNEIENLNTELNLAQDNYLKTKNENNKQIQELKIPLQDPIVCLIEKFEISTVEAIQLLNDVENDLEKAIGIEMKKRKQKQIEQKYQNLYFDLQTDDNEKVAISQLRNLSKD